MKKILNLVILVLFSLAISYCASEKPKEVTPPKTEEKSSVDKDTTATTTTKTTTKTTTNTKKK